MEFILEWSLDAFIETKPDMKEIVEIIRLFMEDEARSCSMDFGCITPLYVYRMWNGSVALGDIETAMAEIKFPGR